MSNLKVMGTGTGYTLISNVFIDQYMITSGSSHLKTYLLLLRLLSDPQKEISVSGMADILDCSESDVLRSLRHWEKKGLMKLTYEPGTGILSEIVLLEPQDGRKAASMGDGWRHPAQAGSVPAESVQMGSAPAGQVPAGSVQEELLASRAPGQPAGSAEAGKAPAKDRAVSAVNPGETGAVDAAVPSLAEQEEEPLPPRQVDFASVSSDENFSRLLFIAEQYIGAPLSRSDCESFAWMYDGLKMETVLLEYLVEYCVSNGHRSVRYMEAVAIDWHRKKIRTVEQARIYTPLHNKNLYAVMKALGLNGRQPAPSERKIIDSWFQEYGFSLDMVVEACNRTMVSIHEPNLNYVESILSRWKKAGISRLDQVQGLDEQFQKQKEEEEKNGSAKRASSEKGYAGKGNFRSGRPGVKKPGAQFHDFEQRDYDYDELLKQINSVN